METNSTWFTSQNGESVGQMINEVLDQIKDKCYVFLVKDPAYYHFEQVWTNKGLEHAKETAKFHCT